MWGGLVLSCKTHTYKECSTVAVAPFLLINSPCLPQYG
jgi:hypothetical protein